MATSTSPRGALAAAIRKINVEYERLSPTQQARVEIVTDAALEAALRGDDRDRALAEVEMWRDRQLDAIRGASQ